MAVTQIALDQYRRRAALARAAADDLVAMWRRVDRDRIAESWGRVVDQAAGYLAISQDAAAGLADDYLREVLGEQGLRVTGERVAPEAFAGVASDGRDLTSLLYQPAITALRAIGGGRSVDDAMTAGMVELDMIVRTQVADAGRVADGVGIVGQPDAKGYTRALTLPSCSRCILLSGQWFGWNAGFERHPRCDCVHVPGRDPDDLVEDPRTAFDSLDREQQDKIFTADGARAIRDGADIGQVVNARRGMQTASVGGRAVSTTTEGTTVRGDFGRANRDAGFVHRPGQRIRSTRRVRLMPEQIYAEAGDDRDKALRLLRANGYLADPRRAAIPAPRQPARDRAAPATGQDALDAVPAGLGRTARGGVKLSRAEADALRDYRSSFFLAINGQLRADEVDDLVRRRIDRIDAAMDRSRLASDVLVWRGITNAARMFGDRLDQDLTGLVWRELAYTSTSAVTAQAREFMFEGAGERPVLMRIVVPAGTRALRVSDIGDQAEILLHRGAGFRVVRDRGLSPDGYRLLDVEVIR